MRELREIFEHSISVDGCSVLGHDAMRAAGEQGSEPKMTQHARTSGLRCEHFAKRSLTRMPNKHPFDKMKSRFKKTVLV